MLKLISCLMEWTDEGCVMLLKGITLPCPVCGKVVTSGERHKCGKKPKKTIEGRK